MNLWLIRIAFLILCSLAGYAVGELDPDLWGGPRPWPVIGFGFGGLLIAIEEMIKGFSLRAFSSTTFGLFLGTLSAWMIDQSGLFEHVRGADGEEAPIRWVIRLSLFTGFAYMGAVIAYRSNKEDFSLIIPFVRFRAQAQTDYPLILDTSAIIDGRVAELLECRFLEGHVIVPRFVLQELHRIADSEDPIKRSRGRHGLDMLSRIQSTSRSQVSIHEAKVESESDVDAKLAHLTRTLGGKLITCDYNLSKVAELQSVPFLRINDLANAVKKVLLPGEVIHLKIVRAGRDKGQGVGYMNDGGMVVVNNAGRHIGQQVEAQVTSLLQTGAGVIVFAEMKSVSADSTATDLPV